MNPNQELIDELRVLEKYYKLKSKDSFREIAYHRAIASIQTLDTKITDMSQVRGLRGVGKAISAKIKDYIDNGYIRQVRDILDAEHDEYDDDEEERVKSSFRAIWGVGRKKADELWDAGFRSIDELRTDTSYLTRNQKIGLKYYDDLLTPIPRKYIDVLQVGIRYVLSKVYGVSNFQMTVAGSYRRGMKVSGDMDFVICSSKFDLKQCVRTLMKYGIVSETLAISDGKFQGIARCPSGQWFSIRLDIEFVSEEEWGSTLLYFTGSKAFNTCMRMRAKEYGLILHQHGLFVRDIKEDEHIDLHKMWANRNSMDYKPISWESGMRIPVYTEEEIFEALGMEYVPPKRR